MVGRADHCSEETLAVVSSAKHSTFLARIMNSESPLVATRSAFS